MRPASASARSASCAPVMVAPLVSCRVTSSSPWVTFTMSSRVRTTFVVMVEVAAPSAKTRRASSTVETWLLISATKSDSAVMVSVHRSSVRRVSRTPSARFCVRSSLTRRRARFSISLVETLSRHSSSRRAHAARWVFSFCACTSMIFSASSGSAVVRAARCFALNDVLPKYVSAKRANSAASLSLKPRSINSASDSPAHSPMSAIGEFIAAR